MAIEGVDYAFPPRPRATELARLGKKFAMRYGGPGSSDKQLDPAEAEALASAGLFICANAEGSASGLLGGFDVGASWARTAEAKFKQCGMPANKPIYLSVDFDVSSAQWPIVANALRGAASVLGGVHRVGIYGGYWAMVWAAREDVARYFWQTYAWSGGRWYFGNHVEQYKNGVILDGADCDLNRAVQADFGQWQPGGSGGITIMFSQKQGVTTPDPNNSTGELYPSRGSGTLTMQKQVNLLGYTPPLSEDGEHGPKTAAGLAWAVGGDGTYYGPNEYLIMDDKFRKPGPPGQDGAPGAPGAPGEPGKTPTEVLIKLRADVTEYANDGSNSG